ncbi:hypothetical protein KY363_04865 [Candidatus Woesearchaeota archaeon]|nr:hypothetical protein [Candidatus Woesearchaeota archaeon]
MRHKTPSYLDHLPKYAKRLVRETIDSIMPAVDRAPNATTALRSQLEDEVCEAIYWQQCDYSGTSLFRISSYLYSKARVYRSWGIHELSNEMNWLAMQLQIMSGVPSRRPIERVPMHYTAKLIPPLLPPLTKKYLKGQTKTGGSSPFTQKCLERLTDVCELTGIIPSDDIKT